MKTFFAILLMVVFTQAQTFDPNPPAFSELLALKPPTATTIDPKYEFSVSSTQIFSLVAVIIMILAITGCALRCIYSSIISHREHDMKLSQDEDTLLYEV
uniref:Col_cuticle_N domain-containing protein n=1 Tax=Caenorhabditis tropicalis TaxID=1561998 RepID=A0A1I7TIC6_9PELO